MEVKLHFLRIGAPGARNRSICSAVGGRNVDFWAIARARVLALLQSSPLNCDERGIAFRTEPGGALSQEQLCGDFVGDHAVGKSSRQGGADSGDFLAAHGKCNHQPALATGNGG